MYANKLDIVKFYDKNCRAYYNMEQLNLNISHLRKSMKLTQAQLADILGVGRTNISNWEKGVSSPGLEHLRNLANYFGFSVDQLISEDLQKSNEIGNDQTAGKGGKMSPNFSHLMGDITSKKSPNKDDTHKTGMAEEQPAPIYQVEKKEGEKDWKLLLPGMVGRVRTFSIFGTSMLPVLRDGDVIICSKVDLADIEDGKVYAVIDTALTINVKYVYPYPDGLLLVPANREEYRPVIIEKKKVLEVWKTSLLLTSNIAPFAEIGASQDLEKKVDQLEHFIRKLFPDYGEIDGDFGK